MNQLPEDIIRYIRLRVNPKWLSRCDKHSYMEHFITNLNDRFIYAYSKIEFISENYTRFLIRNDLHFPFKILHKERMKQWKKITKWKYKNKKFKNYFAYLRELCRNYNSGNCLKIIGYSKNY